VSVTLSGSEAAELSSIFLKSLFVLVLYVAELKTREVFVSAVKVVQLFYSPKNSERYSSSRHFCIKRSGITKYTVPRLSLGVSTSVPVTTTLTSFLL
jgi:hypothetical protein